MRTALVPAIAACLVLSGCFEQRDLVEREPPPRQDDRELAALRAQVAELTGLVKSMQGGHAAPAASGHGAADPRQDPQTAFDRLMQGNRDFVAGKAPTADLSAARRQELAGGQKPIAAFISCADSRSSLEHLFQSGLGDLFVVRSAGNTAFTEAVASTEYAVAHLGVRLVVVMGHSGCGAVKAAAADNHETPAVGALVDAIAPAVAAAKAEGIEPLIERSVVVNAFRQRDQLLAGSALLREREASGQIRVIVARHDLATGEVAVLDSDGLAGAPMVATALYSKPRATAAPSAVLAPVTRPAMPTLPAPAHAHASEPGPAAHAAH